MSETPVPFRQRPRRVRFLLIAFLVACALVAGLDLLLPPEHVHFPWERQWLFYGVYGFVAYTLVVFGAEHVLRPLAMRRENYYGDDAP